MEIVIQTTARDATRLASRIVVTRLRAKHDLVLGCATGRTMEDVYRDLVEAYQQHDLDFSRCHTFNLDEYVGLEPDDPGSYHYYMHDRLFRHVNIDPAHTHLPRGTAPDLETEAQRYESLIRSVGGIDLQLLGLGETGHIGFNEPLSSLMSRTREKALAPGTRQQNAGLFGNDPEKVPARALTMGVGTILEAKEIVMVVTGSSKADILARATEGPLTAMISATALQLHPNCKVIVDEEAAVHLQGTEYYRWIFDNEPEWQPYRG
jgi:glucosamine-6-phosphate deaminase